MRLRSVSLRGLTCFTAAIPAAADFDALGPGLVAMEGDNGAGKTTLVEAVPAALFKELPSRDSWYEYWRGRDGFVEVVFDDAGDEIRVRVQVDAETRKTERYLFVNGESTTTGRAKEADAEVLRRFGSYELFLASVLGSQKRTGNFLDAAKGERKARFVELLGLGRLQVLHEAAKARRDETVHRLSVARSDLATLEEALLALEPAEAERERAQAAGEGAGLALAAARDQETRATVDLERAQGAGQRLGTLEGALRTAKGATADALTERDRALGLRPAAERQAEDRRRAVEAQDPAALEKRADERHAAAVNRIAARQKELEGTLSQAKELEAAAAQVPALEEELARLEAAERALTAAESEKRAAREVLAGGRARLQDAEARLATERQRLAAEAELLDRVPCAAQPVWYPEKYGLDGEGQDLAGGCPLLAAAREAKSRAPTLAVDPKLARAVTEMQTLATAAQEAVGRATLACDSLRAAEIRDALPPLRTLAGRRAALEGAREQLLGLIQDLERANEEKSRDHRAAHELRERQAKELAAIDEDLAKARAEAHRRVSEADTRAKELLEQEYEAERALTAAREELGGLTVPAAEAELSRAREARYTADQAQRAADRALATATERCAQLQARAKGQPALQEAVRLGEQEVGDWTLLAQALGRDGVQALEMDAAAPEVAELTNGLLEACYGTRWTVAFETLREKRSAPGEYSEVFDIRVYDRGQQRAVEGISGGERVIVGEAVALALAIYNSRKSGIRWETLFRDETSGALTLANATAYADMLRRALALGGFHQVVFISHQPEVVERADVRLRVAGGRVTVEGQPASPAPEPAAA